jgi:hypothetical protein
MPPAGLGRAFPVAVAVAVAVAVTVAVAVGRAADVGAGRVGFDDGVGASDVAVPIDGSAAGTEIGELDVAASAEGVNAAALGAGTPAVAVVVDNPGVAEVDGDARVADAELLLALSHAEIATSRRAKRQKKNEQTESPRLLIMYLDGTESGEDVQKPCGRTSVQVERLDREV